MSRARFEGRVAIVTGGSMGIGRSTVLQLVAEGAHVVSCARRKPKLEELEAATQGLSGSFTGYALDVGDTEAFAAMINDTARKHGRLDVLVNNAPSVIGGMVVDQTLEDWRANFGIGVDSVFIGVQAALRIMIPQRSGSIVNISSVAGKQVNPDGGVAYTIAKHGVHIMAKMLNQTELANGIRACVIAPAGVSTRAHDWRPEELRQYMLQPEDVARAVRFAVEQPAHSTVFEIEMSWSPV